MAFNFNVSNYGAKLPWFMYDLYNFQLITSQTIPGDIKDDKDIFLTEVPIPGLNYSPVQPSGNGNRKISFTLPLLKRNNTIGNSLLVKQFQLLRNQAAGLANISSKQFNSNPKVLYFWGTNSIPLEYWVSKLGFTNKQKWINNLGIPQFSEVNIELILDENSSVYKGEELYRKVSAYTGATLYSVDNFVSTKGRAF